MYHFKKGKILLVSILLVFSSLIQLPASSVAQTNIIDNPGFETDPSGTDWAVQNNLGQRYAEDEHSGTYSFRLFESASLESKCYKFEPGIKYRISASTKLLRGFGKAAMNIPAYSDEDCTEAITSLAFSSTQSNTWAKLSNEFSLPSSASAVKVILSSEGGAEVLFDDVELIKIPLQLEITRVTTTEPVRLTDTIRFSLTFLPDWPGDNSLLTIQYSADGQQFLNLGNFVNKKVGDSSTFSRNGNTITVDLALADLGFTNVGTYSFRALTGNSIPLALQSNTATYEVKAKCTRSPPVVDFDQKERTISITQGGFSNPTTVTFKIKITNADDPKCDPSTFDISLSNKEELLQKTIKVALEPKQLTINPGKDQSLTLSIELPKLSSQSISAKINAKNLALERETPQLSSVTSSEATITIPRGCNRQFPLVKVTLVGGNGPDSPGGDKILPGETLLYTASIINGDSAECGPSYFKFDRLVTSLTPEEKAGWAFTPAIEPIEFKNFEGCEKDIDLYQCPQRSIAFKLKSDPETKLSARTANFMAEAATFTLCFKNLESGLTNCDASSDGRSLSKDIAEGRISRDYTGNFEYSVYRLPETDTESPKVDVKLSPEKPFPGGDTRFLIKTSDNVQMKKIQIFIDQGFKTEIPLKDPEEHVETYIQKFEDRIEHSYQVIALDWKDNKACFPSPCEVDGKPNVIKFTPQDNVDLFLPGLSIPSDIKVGDKVTLNIPVINLGNVEAEVVDLELKATHKTTSRIITADVTPKNVRIGTRGESSKFTASFTLDREGEWELKAKVDPENKIAEADETNNELTKNIVVKATVTPTSDCVFVQEITYRDGSKDTIYACPKIKTSLPDCAFVKNIKYNDGTEDNIFACVKSARAEIKDCNFVKLITYSDKTKDNIYACKDEVKSVTNCVFVKSITYTDGIKENIFACST